MIKFSNYRFDEKISKAYADLLEVDKKVDTDNDAGKLGNEMSWLEQSLKEGITNPSDIDRVAFDRFQKLVTRIHWLHTNPSKFEDKKELADLSKYFEEWLDNAYILFDKKQ